MGSTVVGRLQVIVGADSAQITSDTTKIRGIVGSTMRGAQADANAASQALGAIGKPLEGLGPLLKGIQPAAAAAQNAIRAMGMETSAAVSGMTNGLSSLLAGGFTPLSIGIAAGTALLGLWAGRQSAAAEAAEKNNAALTKQVDKYADLGKQLADLQQQREASSRGTTSDVVALEQLLETARSGREDMLTYMRPTGSTGSVKERIAIVAAQQEFDQRIAQADAEIARLEHRLAVARSIAAEQARSRQVDPPAVRRPAAELPSEFLGYDGAVPQIPDYLVNIDNAAANRARRAATMPPEFLSGYTQDVPTLTDAELAIDSADAQQRRAEVQARVLAARRTLSFELAQIGRSETEQAVEAERARYAQLLEEADRYGADRTGLEQELAAKIESIRSAGRAREAGPSMQTILGDFAESEIASGLPRAFEDIARNGRDAGQAMRQFAADFAWAAARVAAQKGLLALLESAFGSTSGSTGSTGGGGSYANTSSSYGGDVGAAPAKMAQTMRSMQRQGQALGGAPRGASKGAQGGQAGNLDATIVVRPPAVIADDVMAKSSPQARAAVVYSVMQRGGRRAERSRA